MRVKPNSLYLRIGSLIGGIKFLMLGAKMRRSACYDDTFYHTLTVKFATGQTFAPINFVIILELDAHPIYVSVITHTVAPSLETFFGYTN